MLYYSKKQQALRIAEADCKGLADYIPQSDIDALTGAGFVCEEKGGGGTDDSLLLESGDFVLLESGDRILLE